MRLRSLLFVPGDRPDRMVKAASAGADALILDLEDSVAPAAKRQAREAVVAFLRTPRTVGVLVRINSFGSVDTAEDLDCVRAGRPDGVVLPKAMGSDMVSDLAKRLPPDMRILPIAAETPLAALSLSRFTPLPDRLCGLTWGAEDLASGVGASGPRLANGDLSGPFEVARAMTLFAAHAAETQAIETVYANFRDLEGLAACAARARHDGFSGMMAIHPSQVPVINAAFTPTANDLSEARAIVDAFDAQPGLGAISREGRMIDRPHLLRARRLLVQAGEDAGS